MGDILDVSHHNGDIGWDAVKKAGHEGVLLKATEGTTFLDPRFDGYWEGARQAGLRVGAYHFLSPRSPADEQARAFARAITKHPAGFAGLEQGLAVDVEWYPRGDHDLWLDLTPDARVAHVATFLETLGREFPAASRPMVYTGAAFWAQMMHNATSSGNVRFADYPLWCPSYKPTPLVAAPWGGKYRLWQYTSTGTVPGVQGNVDLSRASP